MTSVAQKDVARLSQQLADFCSYVCFPLSIIGFGLAWVLPRVSLVFSCGSILLGAFCGGGVYACSCLIKGTPIDQRIDWDCT